MIKRIFDIVVSLILLLALLPVLLTLMIWIKLDSPGPALFLQPRIGRSCRLFRIVKLRSMVANAEQLGSYSTAQRDPRITRVGRFIRRTSLDELPQLMNVLAGDMSLVGPRPDTPMQKSNYSPEQWATRHQVRPGITGLAQARLRSSATHEQRLALDLDYANRPGFFRDLAILFETATTLLSRKAV